jgi:hypothetical protein
MNSVFGCFCTQFTDNHSNKTQAFKPVRHAAEKTWPKKTTSAAARSGLRGHRLRNIYKTAGALNSSNRLKAKGFT